MTPMEEKAKNIADGLAVDSRKQTVSCTELAFRIEKALLSFAKETREAAVKEAIDVFERHNGSCPCMCRKLVAEHMPWNELLPKQPSLFPREAKTRSEKTFCSHCKKETETNNADCKECGWMTK